MTTTSLKTDVAALEARAAVHEVLLLQIMMALYVEPEGGPERVQALMTNVTRSFSRAAREAPAETRQQAELTLKYLEDFSAKILQSAAYVTKH